MSIVIGVCGYSGAGKSTFCQEMARRFRLPALSTGEIVRRRVAERGYELTPANIARVSDEIRRETGRRFLRIVEADLVESFGCSPAVLLDCLREESDLLALRELSARVTVVAITAPDDVRASRTLGRGRPGDPTTPSGLLALDETEQHLGMGRLIAGAGYVVSNDGHLALFIDRSAVVVEAILRS